MMMNQKDKMHPEDQRNFWFFLVTALLVYLAYDHYFIQPQMQRMQQAQQQEHQAELNPQADPTTIKLPRDEVLKQSARVSLDNGVIAGSIALTGGRLDDVKLLKYPRKLGSSEPVDLLSPSQSDYPLYVDFGWLGDAGTAIGLPGPKTVWQPVDANAALKPGAPVTIYWDNGAGLRFERTFALDDKYMFTVTQRVINKSSAPVTLYPYELVSQLGLPEEYMGRRIQEGPIADLDDKLTEVPYAKMQNYADRDITAEHGWIGITEEYWFAGLIPQQGMETKYNITHNAPPTKKGRDHYQVSAAGSAVDIKPGQTVENKVMVFAGAKEVNTLEDYGRNLNIPHFDLVVDFGLYYIITKPLFHLLHFLYLKIGNMGVAIMVLTVFVRLLVFPLANMSYRSFAGLRKIAPKMKEVREKYGDDQTKLQKELVKLYEQEKVNPMAGCLPMVVQIPIFFALYKVMVISIELRHAPFFGWIHDLSAADPTTVFNLFGLIPFDHFPEQLMIGAWPCMMLAVQLLQRNMNPPPQDKMQMYMINVMPFFFCYIMAHFAAGLVVYWTFSGLLAMLQQYVIMRSMGVEVKFFTRPKIERQLAKLVAEEPEVNPGLEVLEDQIEHALHPHTGVAEIDNAPGLLETPTDDAPAPVKTRSNPAAKKKKR
jgi:YidC/Oxa1 family membrane protein insertase